MHPQSNTSPTSPHTPTTCSRHASSHALSDDARQYLASGERWHEQTAKALRRDGNRTLVLADAGVTIKVDRDALVIRNGYSRPGHEPDTYRLERSMHNVDHIVWIAPSAGGSITGAALTWCAQEHITITILDWNGDLQQSIIGPDQRSDAPVRRAQYLAELTGKDVAIARWLVQRKVERQRDTLRQHDLPGSHRADAILTDVLAALRREPVTGWSVDALRILEAKAAAAYFAAWVGHPVRWKSPDNKRVPSHWLTVRERSSTLSDGNRRAVDPTNAILNYTYGCLESQCRQALLAGGLDPACGFLHVDKALRDSLVYDLMELYRPIVDALVLSFISKHAFTRGDIGKTKPKDDDRLGQCQFHPEFSRAVVASCRLAQASINEGIKELRSMLAA